MVQQKQPRLRGGSMEIREYKKGDVLKIAVRLGDDWGGVNETAMQSGAAFTFLINSQPVAVMGIIPVYQGVGGVWCFISDAVRGHGYELCRRSKTLLDKSMAAMNLHRVQAFVERDKTEYIRWSKIMGFNVEGVLFKGAPDKKDTLLVAKVN